MIAQTLIVRVLLLAFLGCSTAADPPAPRPTPVEPARVPAPADARSAPTVRIASYNVNVALVAEESAAALEAINADIVLLQEIGRDWEG